MSEQQKNIEQVTELVQMIAIIMEDFKSQAQQTFESSSEKAQELSKIMSTAKIELDSLLKNSGNIIQKESERSISQSADECFSKLEKRVNHIYEQLNDSNNKIIKSSNVITKQSKIYSWSIIGSISFVSIAIFVFLAFQVKNKRDELMQLQNLYNKTEYALQVKNAMNKISFNVCGQKACVKLDDKAERYGEKGEYIIVE